METEKPQSAIIEGNTQTKPRRLGIKSRERSAKDSHLKRKPKNSQIPVMKSDSTKPDDVKFLQMKSDDIKLGNIETGSTKNSNKISNDKRIGHKKSDRIKVDKNKSESIKVDKNKSDSMKLGRKKSDNIGNDSKFDRRKSDIIKSDTTKGNRQKGRKSYSSSKLCCASHKIDNLNEDLESKIKLLEEKEKSVAQYYLKIDELVRNLTENGLIEKKRLKHRITSDTFARKMVSEPLVFNKEKIKSDILSDLEKNIQEMSKIWLEASTDLSYSIKNLRSNPSLDPIEVELEKVKIHLAIKQTKSLTLLKTRDIIVEAKKLFRDGEMIRTKLENFIRGDYLKKEFGRCECLRAEFAKKEDTNLENEEKKRVGATGDANSDIESQELSISYVESTTSETPGTEDEFSKSESNEDSSSEEKDKEIKLTKPRIRTPSPVILRNEESQKDLARKNEIITNLNNRIFDLQKTCNDHAVKYNQLQIVLSQFEEKIKWNQVLWKQIGKLKEQVKSLNERNRNLESEKTGLECKIVNLDQELERLFKLNYFLNQKKFLLENRAGENQKKGEDGGLKKVSKTNIVKKKSEGGFDEKILQEKQNAINQLKRILEIMKDQENFAQKQISIFQNRIDEFERNSNI